MFFGARGEITTRRTTLKGIESNDKYSIFGAGCGPSKSNKIAVFDDFNNIGIEEECKEEEKDEGGGATSNVIGVYDERFNEQFKKRMIKEYGEIAERNLDSMMRQPYDSLRAEYKRTVKEIERLNKSTDDDDLLFKRSMFLSLMEDVLKHKSTMLGKGLFVRDFGKYPPKMRENLKKYGDEKITKLQVFRYPLKEISFFAKIASFGNLTYDQLFHLGLLINGKYILDKNTVWGFEKRPLKARDGLSIMNVDKFDLDMSINELLEKTRKRIGDEKHFKYKALSTNCQYAVDAMLTTINGNNSKLKDFVKQDMEKVAKSLPGFSEAFLTVQNKVGEVWNRLTQGEGV